MQHPESLSDDQIEIPHGKPLADEIARLVRQFRARDPLSRLTVVTPSIYSAFFLKRAVTKALCQNDKDQPSGMFNVEFLRIEDVADRLFQASPQSAQHADKPNMSRLISFEVIYQAMSALQTPGPLRNLAQSESTVAAVQRTLRELELLDIGAEEALIRLSKNRARNALYKQLLDIYRNYQDVASRYITREHIASIAAHTAQNAPDAVSSVLGKAQILVLADLGADAFSQLRQALQNLSSATTVTPLTTENQDHSSSNDQDESIRFYSSLSPADEPRAVIRNIMSDARKGISFGDMAVFIPGGSGYETRIRDALEAAGIPITGTNPRSLAETPAGRFIKYLLDMVSADMRRDTFATWITASPVAYPETLTRVPAARWDEISRNIKIRAFSEESMWRATLEKHRSSLKRRIRRAEDNPDLDHSGDPDTWRETLDLINKLQQFVNRLNQEIVHHEEATWTQHVDWLLGVIDSYMHKVQARDGEVIHGDLRAPERVLAAIEAIRNLEQVSSSQLISFERFSNTVSTVLAASSGHLPGLGTSVLVASAGRAAGCVFRRVHMVGMTEGNYPRVPRPDPLLPDRDRELLDASATVLPRRRERQEIHRREFLYALFSAPSKRLYWNQAEMGATDNLYPSTWYLEQLRNARPDRPIKALDVMDPDKHVVKFTTRLWELDKSEFQPGEPYDYELLLAADANTDSTAREALLKQDRNRNMRRANRFRRNRRSDRFTEYDGNVKGMSHILYSKPMSATQLERYATCPFQYFLREGLNIDAVEEREEDLSLTPLERGSLVHDILEEFVKSRIRNSSIEEQKALMREIAKERFSQFEHNELIGHQRLYKIETTRIMAQLDQWVSLEAEVIRDYTGESLEEYRFGFDEANEVSIKVAGEQVRLRGMIDRVALSEDGRRAMVIDYKTGQSAYFPNIAEDPVASGTKLQLAIYTAAVRQTRRNIESIDAAYWFVFETGGTKRLPKEQLDEANTRLKLDEVMSTISKGMEQGVFPARPGASVSYSNIRSWYNCRFCDFQKICPSSRLYNWDTKKKSPELTSYASMVAKL